MSRPEEHFRQPALPPKAAASGHFPRLTMYLVGQEEAGHRLPIGQCELAVQVLFPFLAVAEGSGIGNIKHNNTGRGIPVV